MEPAASSVRTVEVFPSASSSLPNYRQWNVQDGGSIAWQSSGRCCVLTRDSCVNTWPRKRGMRGVKVWQQHSRSCSPALRGSDIRKKHQSNQSNLKMKKFDESNLKRAEDNFPKTSPIQQIASHNFAAPTAADGSAVCRQKLIFQRLPTLHFFSRLTLWDVMTGTVSLCLSDASQTKSINWEDYLQFNWWGK